MNRALGIGLMLLTAVAGMTVLPFSAARVQAGTEPNYTVMKGTYVPGSARLTCRENGRCHLKFAVHGAGRRQRRYQAAINLSPDNYYYFQDRYRGEFAERLQEALKDKPAGLFKAPAGLDYCRNADFNFADMHRKNTRDIAADIRERLDRSTVYVLGERFRSGDGVHCVHKNDGPSDCNRRNPLSSDGALFLYHPKTHSWTAFFSAFPHQMRSCRAR